jgi:hypothetical protein
MNEFQAFETHIRSLYTNGEFEKIVEIIDQKAQNYPEERPYLTYWQIGMAARLGKPTLA